MTLAMSQSTESPLRKWRTAQGLSLDEVCDLLERQGIERPSAAKLSRIERDQNIPVEMIAAIALVVACARWCRILHWTTTQQRAALGG